MDFVMKRFYCLVWSVVLFLSVSHTALGQQNDELEAEEIANKVRNMPNIEVGKGISFMPADSLFKLNIRFRMQNYAGVVFDNNFNHERTDLMIKRLRLRLEGFIYSPKLTYMIQLGFTPYDTKTKLSNDVLNVIRDAIVYYVPSPAFSIGFGQTKIKASRAHSNSSSALQFVDRSIVNGIFNVDRDFGLFAAYNRRLVSRFNIVTKASITSGEGRNNNSGTDSGLSYTGRVELFPVGRFKSLGDLFEGDFEREERPKFMFGAAYSHNERTTNLAGQRGEALFGGEFRDIGSYYLDFIYKYKGFAFYSDFMGRIADGSAVLKDPVTGTTQYVYVGNGLNLQTSYLFKSNWEIALRNSTLFPDKEIQPYLSYERFNQTTFGITKYLNGHSIKVQMDASYNNKKMINPLINENGFEFRLQVELGI